MFKFISGVAAGIFLLGAISGANAASGTAMGVDPDAEAQGAETRTLIVGADVFIGDRIVTGPKGQVQILFEDRTELVVGPSSALLLEDYLLREDGSAGKLAINALSGSFRFVTGGAAKDRYVINTPTGTIGVRGTGFDFFVANLITAVMVYEGAVRMCTTDANCIDLTSACEVGQYDTSQATVLGNPDDITGDDRDQLKEWFIYAQSERPLLEEFRLPNAEDCLKRDASAGAPPASMTGPSNNSTNTDVPDPCPAAYGDDSDGTDGGFDLLNIAWRATTRSLLVLTSVYPTYEPDPCGDL